MSQFFTTAAWKRIPTTLHRSNLWPFFCSLAPLAVAYAHAHEQHRCPLKASPKFFPQHSSLGIRFATAIPPLTTPQTIHLFGRTLAPPLNNNGHLRHTRTLTSDQLFDCTTCHFPPARGVRSLESFSPLFEKPTLGAPPVEVKLQDERVLFGFSFVVAKSLRNNRRLLEIVTFLSLLRRFERDKMWGPVCIKSTDAFGILGEGPRFCLSSVMILVYASLAAVDLVIAIVAGIQLLRHYLHNKRIGWTRQKVFHCLIGASNVGYVLYFVLTIVAACKGWTCFLSACGFILIAAPQTLFLATFLLLLSFWVDLCNQANDNEEDDDEDVDPEYNQLPSSSPNHRESSGASKPHRACLPGCLPCRRWRVRGRQRCVIVAVLVIFLFTVAFAVLIWYGMYDNPIDSVKLAQVYANFFALVILLSGGGLAGYGLLLYTKMSRVKSGRASADVRKVAGLAVASVVCFSLKAFLVVMSDLSGLNIWHVKRGDSQFCAPIIFLYYLIGESVPSIVVLWVMRDLPPRSCDSSMNGRLSSHEVLIEDALVPDPNYLSQLLSTAAGRRHLLLLPDCCNSDVSPP